MFASILVSSALSYITDYRFLSRADLSPFEIAASSAMATDLYSRSIEFTGNFLSYSTVS